MEYRNLRVRVRVRVGVRARVRFRFRVRFRVRVRVRDHVIIDSSGSIHLRIIPVHLLPQNSVDIDI